MKDHKFDTVRGGSKRDRAFLRKSRAALVARYGGKNAHEATLNFLADFRAKIAEAKARKDGSK